MLDFHDALVFAKAMETNIKEVDNVISTIQDEFEDKLEYITPFSLLFNLLNNIPRKIWHCATGNHQSSYIFREMLETWRECARDSGKPPIQLLLPYN
jgi:hypothetical protein